MSTSANEVLELMVDRALGQAGSQSLVRALRNFKFTDEASAAEVRPIVGHLGFSFGDLETRLLGPEQPSQENENLDIARSIWLTAKTDLNRYLVAGALEERASDLQNLDKLAESPDWQQYRGVSANELIGRMARAAESVGPLGEARFELVSGLKRFEFREDVAAIKVAGISGPSGATLRGVEEQIQTLQELSEPDRIERLRVLAEDVNRLWLTPVGIRLGGYLSLEASDAQHLDYLRGLQQKEIEAMAVKVDAIDRAVLSIPKIAEFETSLGRRQAELEGIASEHVAMLETRGQEAIEAQRVQAGDQLRQIEKIRELSEVELVKIKTKLSEAVGGLFLDLLDQRRDESVSASNRWLAGSALAGFGAILAGLLLGGQGADSNWTDSVARVSTSLTLGAFSTWFAARSAQTRADARVQNELIAQSRIVDMANEDDSALNEFILKTLEDRGRWAIYSAHVDRGIRRLPNRTETE